MLKKSYSTASLSDSSDTFIEIVPIKVIDLPTTAHFLKRIMARFFVVAR